MSRRDDEWERELKANLARVGTELARGIAAHVQERAEKQYERARERRERFREIAEHARAERHRSKLERKLARAKEKRERRYSQTTVPEGVVMAVIAIALFAFAALRYENLWWLVFIALAFSMRSVGVLSFHAQKKRDDARREAEEAEARIDPRTRRIDETCDKLLAALKDAPENLRAFLSNPEQTVETLRRTCHDLVSRENGLRALANPEEDARLERERATLTQRIEAEKDAVTRQRLASARDALDERRRASQEITRHAARMEAEHTRLTYTLDGLYAQVMRMKTVGTADAGEGVKQSLAQLRDEVGALADALEAANAVPLTGAEPPEHFDGAGAKEKKGVRD